jgi:hypothetical protein
MVIRGRCLCGAVAYEVRLPIAKFVNCYCSRCRKASGRERLCFTAGVPVDSRRELGRPLRPPGGTKLCDVLLRQVRVAGAASYSQRPRGHRPRRFTRRRPWSQAVDQFALGLSCAMGARHRRSVGPGIIAPRVPHPKLRQDETPEAPSFMISNLFAPEDRACSATVYSCSSRISRIRHTLGSGSIAGTVPCLKGY